jgi:hypothetical protein
MKTFKGTVTSDFKVVIPDQIVAKFRADAQSEGSTAFLRKAHEMHPVNDDAFIEMVLKNGLRSFLMHNTKELFLFSGMGATVSPARVELAAVVPDHDAPANINVLVVGEQKEAA